MPRTVTRPGTVAIALLIGTLAFFTYQFRLPAEPSAEPIAAIEQPEAAEPITFTATEPTTAFDLTKAEATIEYEEYSFGNFITSINGAAAPSGMFWQLSHNDAFATVGANDVQLQVGDTITWQLTNQ